MSKRQSKEPRGKAGLLVLTLLVKADALITGARNSRHAAWHLLCHILGNSPLLSHTWKGGEGRARCRSLQHPALVNLQLPTCKSQ